jgi:hypothetical protein
LIWFGPDCSKKPDSILFQVARQGVYSYDPKSRNLRQSGAS